MLLSPGAPLNNFNDTGWGEGGRGSDSCSYFIPKKIPTSEFVYPKKIPVFLAYPKISHTNSKLHLHVFFFFFFHDSKKIPTFFLDPKKSLLAKISDPKNPSDHPVSKIQCMWVEPLGYWVYGSEFKTFDKSLCPSKLLNCFAANMGFLARFWDDTCTNVF